MEVDEFMRLGSTVATSLELFDDAEIDKASKPSIYCLYGILNKCRTSGGKETLKQWIKKPLCDLQRINRRLDIVEALNGSSECRDSLYNNFLRKIHDFTSLSNKLTQNSAKLEDCYNLYKNICMLDPMVGALEELQDCEAVQDFILTPLKRSSRELDKLRSLVQSTVIFNELTQECCIKSEVDEELVSIQEQINGIHKKAEGLATLLRSEINNETVKLESNSEVGFFYRVTLKNEKDIRDSNVTILKTKGSGVAFINPEMEALNKDFCLLNEDYVNVQQSVCDRVIEACGGYSGVCEALAERISFLDCLVAFSVLCCSSANQYVRPVLLDKGTNVFELEACRHPIVENIPFAQSFIPNDVRFEGEVRFTVLTGPNMGGKSTYLKAAAITVILAQMGCYVPCTSATFSVIESIYCRVGADDSQFKGVSTFMQEMLDVAEILNNADSNSFVVIDELGRGTSTYDGYGLAFATAEQIVCELKCRTIFATHFHEMEQLGIYYPNMVKNLKMETHLDRNGGVTILYQVAEGLSERSYGISIARMVGFPQDIIKDAEEELKELQKAIITDEKELSAQKTLDSFQNMNVEEIRFALQNLSD